ncbi:MAG: signal recognition particle protein [Rickettsiales bacterium]|jgi:signal recognition particle subunit SRP54|nr:signal recognition particle protein [Rickettsiales bacterium]
MFDNLARRLSLTFGKLAGRTTLTESMLDDALAEIRIALLEADVSLKVVKKIISDVRDRSIGRKIVEKTTPAETVAKIVYDELVAILGGASVSDTMPKIIMLVGLQGTGKTTTAGKLALYYKNAGKKILLASTDIYRPSAREQLEMLAKQVGVESLPIIENEKVSEIAKRIKKEIYDIAIIDTAGRLQIDDELMDELVEIKRIILPDEILLAADAMAGQESLNIARAFNDRVGITGLVMTRADGDARGGGVLSMLVETGAPVKWVGIGEKLHDLEQFHPDRAASRILGMGDVVSLVEKAQSVMSEKEAENTMKKMLSGDFDLGTMKWQIEKMKKMGPVGGLLKMIPGFGGMAEQLKEKLNDKEIDKHLAILRSMTKDELRDSDIILQSRKERIARGSGVGVRDVENLLKKFARMKSQMKMLKNAPGFGNL